MIIIVLTGSYHTKYEKGCVVITAERNVVNLVIPTEYEPDLFLLKKELYWNHSQAAMFRELIGIGIKAKLVELERRNKDAHKHETYDDHRT